MRGAGVRCARHDRSRAESPVAGSVPDGRDVRRVGAQPLGSEVPLAPAAVPPGPAARRQHGDRSGSCLMSARTRTSSARRTTRIKPEAEGLLLPSFRWSPEELAHLLRAVDHRTTVGARSENAWTSCSTKTRTSSGNSTRNQSAPQGPGPHASRQGGNARAHPRERSEARTRACSSGTSRIALQHEWFQEIAVAPGNRRTIHAVLATATLKTFSKEGAAYADARPNGTRAGHGATEVR